MAFTTLFILEGKNKNNRFQVKPLIWVETVVEKHTHSRVEYMVKVR